MSLKHRLAKLETIWPKPAPLVSRFHHPWLTTRSDADLDVMDEALGHLESGGDADMLPPAIRDRYAVIRADFREWAEAQSA
jgi:hypothetical protein